MFDVPEEPSHAQLCMVCEALPTQFETLLLPLARSLLFSGASQLRVHRRCEQVSDDGLAWIGLMRSLTSLDLARCYHVTDGGLRKLVTLTRLTSLNLTCCEQVRAPWRYVVSRYLDSAHLRRLTQLLRFYHFSFSR